MLFSNRLQIKSNVVRTRKRRTKRSQVCHWCSSHILTSSVIYYWTNPRQRGIYLFYVIKKENVVNGDFIRASFSPIDHKNQSNYVWPSTYHINKTVVIVTVAVPFPNSSTMTSEFSVAAFTAVATWQMMKCILIKLDEKERSGSWRKSNCNSISIFCFSIKSKRKSRAK